MIASATRFLQRFRRDESGSVTMMEFVIMFPLIFATFMMAVELGIYSTRQLFLDRGLDMTVRFVRLNTNTPMTHNQLKAMICTNAGFLERDGQILSQMGRIADIPGTIVQGRYDMICPPVSAHGLHRAWPASVLQIVPRAGHALSEPAISAALVRAMDDLR